MIRPICAGITPPPAHGLAERRKNGPLESSQNREAAAEGLQPVSPVRPVAAYIGGKRNLARRLVPLIASVPHDLYAEPFVGMG
ncbi:MAG: adenine methylase, partial [Sphingomonadales bacterium]|nr:adenine methylase [Sphingomonadales bacterium]